MRSIGTLIVFIQLCSSLAMAQVVEPSVQPQPQPLPAATPPQAPAPVQAAPPAAEMRDDRKPRISIGVGYHTGSEAKFNSITVTTGTATGSGEYSFNTRGAPSLFVGVLYAPRNDWGGFAGVSVEANREIDSERITINGTSIASTYSGSKPSIQLSLVEINALYRWDKIYLPFGFNYSIPTFNKSPGATTDVTVSGALGGQLGVGFFLTEHIHLDVYSKVMSVTASLKSGSSSADLKRGLLPGVLLRVGYIF